MDSYIGRVSIYASSETSPGRGGPFGAVKQVIGHWSFGFHIFLDS